VAEEDGGDGGADEEEEEDEDEEDEYEEEEEEEEREGVQLVAGDCEPPPRARVSGVAAAAAVETANTSTYPVCMEPWTSQGPHRIRWVTNAPFALSLLLFLVCMARPSVVFPCSISTSKTIECSQRM